MTGHYKSAPEDRLTSLHDDLLTSILSFLPIKQRVALSAVCARFRRLLPSIPRLDAFRLDVNIHKDLTFPGALIRQCHLVIHDVADLPEPLEQLLVDGLVEAGVQDLILQSDADKGWLNFSDRDCGFFGIKSLRRLLLHRIVVSKYSDRRPLSSLGCALLTSLDMRCSALSDDFLGNLLASCPFLETLRLILCNWSEYSSTGRLSIHSASIKHLVLLGLKPDIDAVDIHGSMLESMVVDVVNDLHIEAPKAQIASFSFIVDITPWRDPSVVLMDLFRVPFPRGPAHLVLNSGTAPNRLTAIDEVICLGENGMIFNLDFNLKDQSSSTMILAELLKKYNNYSTKFDIRTDSTHIQSASSETATDNEHLIHRLTGSDLIKLRLTMPEKRFEELLSNKKKLKKLKNKGLKMLRRRTSNEVQFVNILVSEEAMFQVSSSIANCIEMKF